MSISQRSAINERDDGGSRERVTFSFGKNWFQFIKRLTPQIVASAELDLKNWLPGLAGKRVLDVGSGSGLSSLAFLRLGAAEVVSFDYDKYSVAATMRLRENRSQGGGWGGGTWHVFRGSVLDPSFVWHLGRFDIVFSWGVLHHTGQMHRALANLAPVVRPDGMLMVTLYQGGGKYERDLGIKRRYNTAGGAGKRAMIKEVIKRRKIKPAHMDVVGERGMSVYHNIVDWLGGLPFEVAYGAEIEQLYRTCHFTLTRWQRRKQGRCSYFLFSRTGSDFTDGATVLDQLPGGVWSFEGKS